MQVFLAIVIVVVCLVALGLFIWALYERRQRVLAEVEARSIQIEYLTAENERIKYDTEKLIEEAAKSVGGMTDEELLKATSRKPFDSSAADNHPSPNVVTSGGSPFRNDNG